MYHTIELRTPAERFSEAFPIGNGSLGAMVYGNGDELKLSLNRDTLWSGSSAAEKDVLVSSDLIEEVRCAIRNADYAKAQQLTAEHMLGPWSESYISAGTLEIRNVNHENSGVIRRLRMDTGVAESRENCLHKGIRTKCFSSLADDVIAVSITAEEPTDFEMSLSALTMGSFTIAGREIIYDGEAPLHVEPNYVDSEDPICYEGGMPYQIRVRIASCDGDVHTFSQQTGERKINGKSPMLKADHVKSMIVLISVETGFDGWNRPVMTAQAVEENCMARLNNAGCYVWDELLSRHTAIHTPLYKRIAFALPEKPEIVRSYQYGRYLMIASSYPIRPFTQPGNLQGIWCEDIRPMWSCNWTVNINVEMNYWITGPGRLTECDKPYIVMMQELAEAGQKTAHHTCQAEGFAVFHNTDLWRLTCPVGGDPKWAYWPMAGVWMATHLYEHYLFTGDIEELRNETYPVLKGAAQFCLDWMVEGDDGLLYTMPSTSPENEFLDENRKALSVTASSTMDIALIRELLTNLLDAAKDLQEEDELTKSAEDVLKRLPGYKIGRYGQLQEWLEDFEEADPGHRHMAHLVGLHPFAQITPEKTPDLADAARVSLHRRIERNTFFIGWTESWLTCFFARLKDAEQAQIHADRFLTKCSYPNLMSLHPPLGGNGEWEIFQIDGNFGFSAGINEMLMQSTKDEIDLLPALPEAWQTGSITGLGSRCNVLTDLSWEQGKLKSAKLYALADTDILVKAKDVFCMIPANKMPETGACAIQIHLNQGECITLLGGRSC